MNRVSTTLLLLFLVGTGMSNAESVSDQPAADAIKELGKSSWYDPEQETIVPIQLRDTSSDSSHRDSRWLPKAKRIAKQSTTSSSSTSTGFSGSNLIGWTILGVGLVVIAGAILYAFSKLDPDGFVALANTQRSDDKAQNEQRLKRIMELPVELRRTDVDLRTEAERLMNLGQLDEAIKCLFGHQLITLDRCGFLRLSRGKTNGRYVTETKRDSPEAALLLKSTVLAFEASYFGSHTPAVELFRQLWQGNSRLEALTIKTSEVAL